MTLRLGNNKKNIQSIDHKKITVSTAYKNKKTYRTYQINIKQTYIKALLDNYISEPTKNEKIQLYLAKKHKQHYKITKTSNTIDKTIQLNVKLNNSKKTTPVTLPKNDMEYIKAYDTYLETLDKINAEKDNKNNGNDCFKAAPLKATVLLQFIVDDITNEFKTELEILNIRTIINKDFIEYVKKQNNNILPSWLDMLITDWNKEYINTILNISN